MLVKLGAMKKNGNSEKSKGKLLEWYQDVEKNPMMDRTVEENSRPPVRVIVSYPQSQEWDGKYPQPWRKYALSLSIIILVSAALCGMYFCYKNFFINYLATEESEIKMMVPINMTQQVKYQILTSYEERLRGDRDFSSRLGFYDNEFKKLIIPDSTDFFTDIGISVEILSPNETDSIKKFMISYLLERKICLTQLTHEVSYLSSYNFHKNGKTDFTDESLSNFPCNLKEKSELTALRKDYQSPTLFNGTIVSGKVVLLRDVNNYLKSKPELGNLIVIASTLYLDANISHNVDLAIFANNWKFISTPIEINLSGKDAVDPYWNVSDGKQGESGGDAGYFLAVGLSDIDKDSLSVSMDGGSAASGYNGPNGRHGVPGIMPESTNQGEKHCVVKVGPSTRNPAGQPMQMYAVFDNRTCAEVGGAGGPAGLPGKAGQAVFVMSQDELTFSGSDGESAKDGNKGQDGKSLFGDCYYMAYKYRVMNLLPPSWAAVTRPNCQPDRLFYNLPMIPNYSVKGVAIVKEKPVRNLTVFHTALIRFSAFAREKWVRENDRELFSLLQKTESSRELANMSTIADLYEAFDQLDRTYSQLEIFESFAQRLAKVRQVCGNAVDQKKLAYLEALVWSKVAALNTKFGVHYIVDIESYLEDTISWFQAHDKSRFPRYTSNTRQEITMKLNETRELLTGLEKIGDGLNETDTLVIPLLTMRVLPQFADILSDYLKNEFKPERSLENLETALRSFDLSVENGNVTVGEKLIESLEQIRADNLLESIGESLQVIRNELWTSLASSVEGKKWLIDLQVAVSDFSSLLYRIKQSFNEKQVEQIVAQISWTAVEDEFERQIEQRVLKNLLFERYLKALDAYKQSVYPYWDSISTLPENATKEEFINAVTVMLKTLQTDRTTIKVRDSEIIEATFHLHSPTRPFYSWLQKDHPKTISDLLSGQRVQLRANIAESAHGISKQAIKFRVAEIYLAGVPKSVSKNFHVTMTHSGFSHFIFNGTATTIIGPQFNIDYSLDTGFNWEPSVRNDVYMKIKDGDVFLSPYTTWFVQLKPLNSLGSFDNLQQFVSKTDVHLVGVGRYTSFL